MGQTEVTARLAGPDDADELVRLRGVMIESMDGTPPMPGEWQRHAVATLRARFATRTLAAFVIDQPERAGQLAACALGAIEHRLGGPDNPTGEIGYIFNVATEGAYRRRGYSRACLTALLGWYRDHGVSRIDLRASAAGEPLYRSLGFVPTSGPTLRLRLTR